MCVIPPQEQTHLKLQHTNNNKEHSKKFILAIVEHEICYSRSASRPSIGLLI